MMVLDLLVAKEGDDRFLPRSIRTPTDDDHERPETGQGLALTRFGRSCNRTRTARTNERVRR
jgi:hypothetical protein